MSFKRKFRPQNIEIQTLVNENNGNPEAILEIFQELQNRHGGLTRDLIEDTAITLGIPSSKAFGIATFYSMLNLAPHQGGTLHICDGPVCWLKNASRAKEALHQAIRTEKSALPWEVKRSSCLGLCDRAPAMLINGEQAGPVTPSAANEYLHEYTGTPSDYRTPRTGELRVMLANTGVIEPDSIESAISHGAYSALRKALTGSPDQSLQIVETSGLTGRGGAGFPVGRKWRFVAQETRHPKHIICNADESEPLIFKDRVLIDTNPHQILEGMIIAGYATGAQHGTIYIRGEYERQARRLEHAIEQAETHNILGEAILSSEFTFHIHVHRGAGAYICGEETALIESIEGSRGEPRFRPPYPPSYGVHGNPTLVNNVESFASVPSIIQNGADWYRNLSSYPTPGTKLYMILGHINNPGLFEAPFGITLRQAIEDFGGGMLPGSNFLFALTGGAAGTIVSSDLLDIPIDYASTNKGISLGAGAFLICDHTISPVAFLRELLHFFTAESCGKCTPCRIGTIESLEILNRLTKQQGKPEDVSNLLRLADVMQAASFCGLGQSVAIPVKSAIRVFESDFISSMPGEVTS